MVNKTVLTTHGRVRGKKTKGADVWRNIPYAQPPIGGLRFRHARPHNGWDGVLDATGRGRICPQPGMGRHSMDEDCLTLNIWAPEGADGSNAVLLYIHGGSFCRGTGNDSRYDGRKLATRTGMIVVNINYRLGALGFMDFSFLGDGYEVNCGLSDIMLALQWVHENIAAFGGDPGNITVAGQSAGANAVSTLVTLPQAKPYISKAIVMSGSPVWMHEPRDAQRIAQDFMRFMGITDAERLRSIPAAELTARQNKFIFSCKAGESTFAIVVDGDMVPSYPIPAAGDGTAKGIPMLIGTTRDESSLSCSALLSKVIMIKDVALSVLFREKKEVREGIINAHSKYGLRQGKRMFVTDQIFRMCSVWYTKAYARYADIWAYSFNYETLSMKISTLGACHSSDIPFLFGNYGAPRTAMMFMMSPITTVIQRISASMQEDFSAFAKTGKLPWKKCSSAYAPAKCYDRKTRLEPMVDLEIEQAYEKSEFKRRSVEGLSPGSPA